VREFEALSPPGLDATAKAYRLSRLDKRGMTIPPPPVTDSDRRVFRILDANLDRAREGLRILEDWCRFGLNHHELTEKLKHLRQSLAQWHTAELRAARDTPGDTGTSLTHAQERQRQNVTHVLQANFCRVEEALRSLEEFGKIHHPDMAAACKQFRYQVYTLESTVLGHQRFQQLTQAQLYLVTSPVETVVDVVESALQGGLQMVQYREKEGNDCDRIVIARHLKDLCQRYGALFLINDRVDLALAVDADGVHLGQQDLPIAVARDLLGHHRIIGRSTTNPEEMAKALAEGADYIGVGPVYATPTKPGKASAGLDYVRYAAANSSVPFFAIGGIDAQNLDEVMAAGGDRVAIVRALMKADDPAAMSQQLLARLQARRSPESATQQVDS
jgi:thiamine-phosphate pyrophosphorylase